MHNVCNIHTYMLFYYVVWANAWHQSGANKKLMKSRKKQAGLALS